MQKNDTFDRCIKPETTYILAISPPPLNVKRGVTRERWGMEVCIYMTDFLGKGVTQGKKESRSPIESGFS